MSATTAIPTPAAPPELAPQRRARVRKSIAHMPPRHTLDDKENTAPVIMPGSFDEASAKAASRKTRSKSIGPGGLNGLESVDVGPRRMSSVAGMPKSILMPTIPLSPLQEIPIRKPSPKPNYASPTRASAQKSASPSKMQSVATPSKSPSREVFTRSVQQESEQETQARRAERERAQQHREARRKSMAARRVSFAPEATLHTWDVVEYNQESTTSTASTSSARDGMTAGMTTTNNMFDDVTAAHDPLLSRQVPQSPERQSQDLKQDKPKRRSSATPLLDFHDPNNVPLSDHASASEEEAEEGDSEAESVSSENNLQIPSSSPIHYASDEDGDASMELTGVANMEDAPLSNDGVQSAQEHAHSSVQDILSPKAAQMLQDEEEDDDGEEMSMELAGNDITAAFRPWVERATSAAKVQITPKPRLSSMNDQENLPQLIASPAYSLSEADDDMSMDMTRVAGGILAANKKQSPASRRQSTKSRRASKGPAESPRDDTTAMDFTIAVGGIRRDDLDDDESLPDENEELSMEFTTALGGFRSMQAQAQSDAESAAPKDTDAQAVAAEEGTMDMTAAIGGILGRTRKSLNSTRRSGRLSVTSSATGSPARVDVPERRMTRSSKSPRAGITPERQATTRSKQVTPQASDSQVQGTTPPPANAARRSTSPQKLFQAEIKSASSPSRLAANVLEEKLGNTQDANTATESQSVQNDLNLPSTPQPSQTKSRRLSDILKTRASIVDQAPSFSPTHAAVKFADAQSMEAEVDRERSEAARRESGQFVLEQEANSPVEAENATVTLREMMQSMTPKKNANKSKPRKSLHVGAAKGILGKRPAELDESEDERSPFRGREASPVKKIRLQAPPPLSARKITPDLFAQEQAVTPTLHRATRVRTASTPRSQGRFKDAELIPSAQKAIKTFGEHVDPGDLAAFAEQEKSSIKLQDFLDMTAIRFMDALDTTKRRHTMAPSKKGDEIGDDFFAKEAGDIFEEAAVAGATTVPLYDLYQHACHETKQYIKGGRKILRQLEDQSSQENPPLFSRYMSASPEERSKMDAQFKIIKGQARSLSKESWYEWRSKLWDGLGDSLRANAAGLDEDLAVVEETERFVEEALPRFKLEKERLQNEYDYLNSRADELKGVDPKELQRARSRLRSIEIHLQEKRQRLEQHRKTLKVQELGIENASSKKTECGNSIAEAKRKHEQCRGWSVQEVRSLSSQVAALEKSTGWSIASASGTKLVLIFQAQLELHFDTAAFLPVATPGSQNSAINLAYISQSTKSPIADERRLCLQVMQAHLASLPQAETDAKDMLRFVKNAWIRANSLSEQVARLAMLAPTSSESVNSNQMLLKTSILIPETRSKVEVDFAVDVTVGSSSDLVVALASAAARCCYGEAFKEPKMKEFLEASVRSAEQEPGVLARAVAELSKKLAVRNGKKA